MFIAHFNRYFEKHARITYIVLLLIIIATFVIFVTPGEVFRGEKTISDFGEIYGKKLTVERVQKEMANTTVGCWFQYPQIFGSDLSSNKEMLFTEMLNRMRLLHYAKEQKMDKVSDDEVKDIIASCAAFQKDGTFDSEMFQNFLDYIKRSYDILPSEFDDILRGNVAIDRVTKFITESVAVNDSDVDSELTRFTLKGANIALDRNDSLPTEEELQNFFTNRKADIKLPESKNALVALFKFDDIKKAQAGNATLAAELTPSAEEIKSYFDRNADTSYKGKTLAEVTNSIVAKLTDDKIRSEARRRAGKLYDTFRTRVQDESNAARLQRFRQEAEAAGAVCQTSGLVSTEDVISGMEGNQASLAGAIRTAAEVGDVTRMAIGAGYAAVAYITEKMPTALPDALPAKADNAAGLDKMRQLVADAIVNERAKAFFEENIKKPFEAYQATVKTVQEDKTLDDNAKWMKIRDAEAMLDSRLVTRFYIEEKRDFAMVTFEPAAYAEKLQAPTEDELAKAYEAVKDEYMKVRVRLSKMVFRTAGLEGEALDSCLKQAAEALAAVRNGADFAAAAKQFCEGGKTTDDAALVELDSLSASVKAAVANLKAGDVSAVIEDGGNRVIVKVQERQDGRTLADVHEELSNALKDDAARQLADDAAAALAAKLNESWWDAVAANGDNATGVDGVALLKELAAAYPEAKYELLEEVSPLDRMQLEPQLLNKIFSATVKAPVTSNIIGQDASYVGCLSKIIEGHLAAPAEDSQYASVLKAVYGEKMQKDAALKRAEAEKARIAAALAANGGDFAAAAGSLEFKDLPEFSINDIRNGAEVTNEVRNNWFFELSNLLPELDKAAAGSLLGVQTAEREFSMSASNPYARTTLPYGYQLLYVAERKAAAPVEGDEAAAKVREDVRKRLLAQKQQQALMDFMTDLEAKSNTYIRPETSFGRM